MRRLAIFLVILVVVYLVSQASKKKDVRSPLRKRFSETLTIIVWVMLVAYVLSFFYWLYTQIFK
jgi:magnesium-transporting ATPase (P-type)